MLAIRRGGRYVYRPGGDVGLLAGDELIASGPDEGHPMLTELLGWRLDEDEETGEQELVPLTGSDPSRTRGQNGPVRDRIRRGFEGVR